MEEIIKAFRNEQFGEIRTLEIEGKPYFVATGTKPLTVWILKGRMFLYQRLKNIGIEPDMERNI